MSFIESAPQEVGGGAAAAGPCETAESNAALRGVPRWRDMFPQYGIKVSYWGSGTLKIVIPVENHPQKPKNRLADYNPLWGGGC